LSSFREINSDLQRRRLSDPITLNPLMGKDKTNTHTQPTTIVVVGFLYSTRTTMCTNTFIMKYQVKKSGSKFGIKVGFVAMELTFDEIVSNIDDLTGFFRACLPEDSIKDFEQSLGEVKPYLDLIPQRSYHHRGSGL